MREAKSKELKKDIEILSQTFERVVDRKDSVIKSLAKDLQEAEEQYAMALRSHLQNVDYLIGKFFLLRYVNNSFHCDIKCGAVYYTSFFFFCSTDLQTERLATLKHEYMEEQMTLMNEFDTERAMLIEQHMQEMNDLQVNI